MRIKNATERVTFEKKKQRRNSFHVLHSVERVLASDSLRARVDPHSAAVRLPMLDPAACFSRRALILVADPLEVVLAVVVLVLVVRGRVARHRGNASVGEIGL